MKRDADTLRGLSPSAAQREHLAELLNYNLCGSLGELDNVFDLRDGGYGYALRVAVPAIECMPNGASLCAQVIDNIIRALPTGYTCQVVRRTVSNIRRQMMAYADVPSVGELAELFAQARLDQFAAASLEGFIPDETKHNFFPGSEELYVFISTPDFYRLTIGKLLTGGAYIDQKIQEFRSAIQAVRKLFQSVNLQAEPLDAATFTQYVVSVLNVRMIEAQPYTPKVMGDELPEAISKAITLEEIDTGVGFVSVWNDSRTHFRCLSMIWQPDGVKPGMIDQVVAQERDCAFVATIRILDTREVSFRLKAKRYLTGKMRMGSLNAEEIDELNASIGDALRRAVNGERFVDVRFNVLVTAPTQSKAEERSAEISNQLALCGMQYVDVERDIGASVILNGCLPFPRADYERAFSRARRMLSADVAELMPVGGTWAGTLHKPFTLYANRVGRPFLFNPMVSPRNSNFLVVADSGSGKSFWTNDFLTQTARLPGAYQFIVSMKPDYRKFAAQFGTEIDLNLDSARSISPFWGPPDNDAIDLWSKIVLGMVAEHPSQPSSTEIKQAISAAVSTAARRNWDQSGGERELQLTDIQLELANSGSMGAKLAKALFDYVDTGRYAKLFQGPSTIKPGEHRRIFFNLRGIVNTDAGRVALMCVMRTIDAVMSDERLRGVPKIAIFDEGWSLVASEFGGAFIERAVRTYRSLGGTVGFITQDPRDLDTVMGRSVLGNTATKIVLPLDPNVVGSLGNYIDMNAAERRAISSLSLVKGLYSEFFVKMGGVGATVGRLVPFPLAYAMNTTSPDDEAVQFSMLNDGLTPTQMLEKFAAVYPRGVYAAESQQAEALA